jgi:two-component system chemotaxis sensor kinase CheA
VLLVVWDGHTYAISSANIKKLARLDASEFHTVSGRTVVTIDGEAVSAASLGEILGFKSRGSDTISQLHGTGRKLPVVVLTAEERQVACFVDEFIAEQEVMVKNLGSHIKRLRHIAGATILPNGRVALTINAADVIHSAARLGTSGTLRAISDEQAVEKKVHRLLVVDDSITTRGLEKSILEAAGYIVNVATDGLEGWEVLQRDGADLLMVDAEMPRMDGFELIATIRKSERFKDLPAILVTSLDDEKSKARGMQAGASAYVVKGAFDQVSFLNLVERLL